MTKETVEQFLARGGKVDTVPQGISGHRGGILSLNREEMAAKRRHKVAVVFMNDPDDHFPRFRKR